MPNAEPGKRKWFQIHLSTAVALLVVSGALLWANFASVQNVLSGYGWPTFHYILKRSPKLEGGHWYDLDPLNALGNPIAAALILWKTAVACE